MWNFNPVVIVLFIILTLITTFISVKQPSLHKQTMFTDEYNRFTEDDTETGADICFSNPNTPHIQVIESGQKEKHAGNSGQPPIRIAAPAKPDSLKEVVRSEKPPMPQNPKTPLTQPANKNQNITQPPQKQPEQLQQEIKNPIFQGNELSERDEIIAWNKWRSNLQNQVMMDSKISAPLGTRFKFSFTVDKYGNMSNIKVWSTNPTYTTLAVKVIKPILVSYQHKPILNFPTGTKRTITNVTGSFYMSTTAQYSKPSDYSDYERVKICK